MLGRLSDTGDTNGDDTTSSSSSEEEKEADCSQPEKEPGPKTSWATSGPANGQLVSQAAPGGDTTKDEDEQEEEEEVREGGNKGRGWRGKERVSDEGREGGRTNRRKC